MFVAMTVNRNCPPMCVGTQSVLVSSCWMKGFPGFLAFSYVMIAVQQLRTVTTKLLVLLDVMATVGLNKLPAFTADGC